MLHLWFQCILLALNCRVLVSAAETTADLDSAVTSISATERYGKSDRESGSFDRRTSDTETKLLLIPNRFVCIMSLGQVGVQSAHGGWWVRWPAQNCV